MIAEVSVVVVALYVALGLLQQALHIPWTRTPEDEQWVRGGLTVSLRPLLAALAALLMLLGYSIDTNILLTARLLKTHDTPLRDRMKSAFKTGITMTGTTTGALVAVLLVVSSGVLSQIAAVLLIGLITDVCLTWMQNAVLLNWYMEKKEIA